MPSFAAGMYVNTNLNAIGTQRNLGASSNMMSKSLEKLSSGYRINVASDDPSGFQISEQLRSQQSGMNRAIQNSQEAANVISIAEGAMIEMNAILTKMRQLAIHAANEGATSPEQVSADQAEIDSGIQTIDRIANTTKFSDQFLLNGSKSLIFNTTTVINDSSDNTLIDATRSRLDQVFKRGSESSLNLNFTGYDARNGDQVIADRQARRAVFEADKTMAGMNNSSGWVPDIIDGYVTATQRFILTGNSGSRAFSFMDGTHLGTIAEAVNGVRTSTGIAATLTFDSGVTGIAVNLSGMTSGSALGSRISGETAIYNINMSGVNGSNNSTIGAASVTTTSTGTSYNANALVPGYNLDADGRMYLQWQDDKNYIAYKDAAMTMEVGRGGGGGIMTSSNNSNVSQAYLSVATGGSIALGNISVLQFGQQFQVHSTGTVAYSLNGMTTKDLAPLQADLGLNLTSGATCFSGIRLQENTSADARLYFQTEYNGTAIPPTATVRIYNNATMLPEYLVAEGSGRSSTTGGAAYQISCTPRDGDRDGKDSGIFATLAFNVPGAGGVRNTSAQGSLEFDQLGLRMYSTEYGSEQYIRLQNLEGNLLGKYAANDSDQLNNVKIGNTLQSNGGDALLSINGQLVRTQGLVASVSSQNYSGMLCLNAGSLGMTTIAQVGHDVGALMNRGGALQAVPVPAGTDSRDPSSPGYLTWVTNGRHITSENLNDFIGGMQYQLGEGENDIERTIYSLPSMAAAILGKSSINGKIYTLQDVLSGGSSSLANDPIKAMHVIRQALDDVTGTRARLGAFQKNMLITNINSMEISVENIVKTESYIRDTNMAYESTEYTKNQILVNAGTSMLAQANRIPQNVLQLLG